MDQKVVDRLFRRLQAAFPKWREIWQTDGELLAAKKQWTRTIVKQGLADPHMLKLGIERAEEIGWVRPPSPAQFCQWCLDGAKEMDGIPSRDDAVSEIMTIASKGDHARRRTKMSPPIYQACRLIDWYQFSRMDVEKAAKAAGRAYDQMVDHWMSGKPFEEQPVMVEDRQEKREITEEDRKKGIEVLSKLLGDLG